ncbi:MAG: hypothetical protein CMH54_13620 [Myxococcales bacterium]|nr:hypothetical protein [Myxococcales bacterium]
MTPRIAVIGCGRVGSFLVRNASRRGLDVQLLVQDRESVPTDLNVPVVEITAQSQDTVPTDRDVIFLAVTESSFPELCALLQQYGLLDADQKQPILAHMSGAYPGSYLEDYGVPAHRAASFHPMHPFRHRESSPDSQSITAAIDGQDDAIAILQDVANHLELTTVRIPAQQRSLYHLACVLAANHVVTLAHHARRIAADVSANNPEMNQAIHHLMRASLDNLVASDSAEQALTGPVARGDLATLRKHEQALREQYPELCSFYRAMVEATLPLVSDATSEQISPFLEADDGD